MMMTMTTMKTAASTSGNHKGHQDVGYVRVSSMDQNTDRQLAQVIDGLDRVFEDKASGKDTHRPELKACLAHLRQGDTLHVHSMDRLSRSLVDLLKLVKELTGRGVAVKFHKECLVFTGEASPMQDLQLAVMGAVAEFERAMIRERQREGIEAYKAKGGTFGPKAKLTQAQTVELVQRASSGENRTELAKEYGISRARLYQILASLEAPLGDDE